MVRKDGNEFIDILEVLRKRGVLLETDRAFPSLAAIMAGGPLRGPWEAHPLRNEIYMMSQRLAHHEEVLFLKLLSGKFTYVHRRLWPTLIAVATSRERWQLDSLTPLAKRLLDEAEERGCLRIDQLESPRGLEELGAQARMLEARLLVFGDGVHTGSGAHVKRIETWEHWAWRTGFPATVLPPPEDARAELDEIVERLNADFGAEAKLPWTGP